jgi:hypothetical protein
MLYATTRRFLEVFGLAALEDLPSLRDLHELASSAEATIGSGGAAPSLGPEGDPDAEAAALEAADAQARDFTADDAELEEEDEEPEEPVGRRH